MLIARRESESGESMKTYTYNRDLWYVKDEVALTQEN